MALKLRSLVASETEGPVFESYLAPFYVEFLKIPV